MCEAGGSVSVRCRTVLSLQVPWLTRCYKMFTANSGSTSFGKAHTAMPLLHERAPQHKKFSPMFIGNKNFESGYTKFVVKHTLLSLAWGSIPAS